MKTFSIFFFISLIIISLFSCCHIKNKRLNNRQFYKHFNNQKVISLDGDTINLKDTLKLPSLIFRFSVLDCQICIDSTILLLKKQEKINSDHIACLSYYKNIQHYVVFNRVNRIDYNMFLLSKNKINTLEDSLALHSPYLFIIDKEFKVKRIFKIPKRNINKSISKYINTVSIEFFKNK